MWPALLSLCESRTGHMIWKIWSIGNIGGWRRSVIGCRFRDRFWRAPRGVRERGIRKGANDFVLL